MGGGGCCTVWEEAREKVEELRMRCTVLLGGGSYALTSY